MKVLLQSQIILRVLYHAITNQKNQRDFELFKNIITVKVIPARPPHAEFIIDTEILYLIAKEYLGKNIVLPGKDLESRKAYWDTYIELSLLLVYDFVTIMGGLNFATKLRTTIDSSEGKLASPI